MERLRILITKKRAGLSLAALALVAAGCNDPIGQIGTINLVDCENGLRSNQQSYDLSTETDKQKSRLDLSVHKNGNFDLDSWADLTVISAGNGNVKLKYEDYAPRADRVDRRPTILPNGEIVFDSAENIHYNVKHSEGPNGTTHLVVDLSCNKPQ